MQAGSHVVLPAGHESAPKVVPPGYLRGNGDGCEECRNAAGQSEFSATERCVPAHPAL